MPVSGFSPFAQIDARGEYRTLAAQPVKHHESGDQNDHEFGSNQPADTHSKQGVDDHECGSHTHDKGNDLVIHHLVIGRSAFGLIGLQQFATIHQDDDGNAEHSRKYQQDDIHHLSNLLQYK